MAKGLEIPQKGSLDLVSLGALNHRVDLGIIPFRKATEWQVHPSGGEFNVAANLADCFRLHTGIVLGHGRLSHWRPDRRARAGDGR